MKQGDIRTVGVLKHGIPKENRKKRFFFVCT